MLFRSDFSLHKSSAAKVAIFTDGIENLVLRKADRTVHAPFFDSMFPAVRRSQVSGVDEALSRELEKYLSGPLICDRTHDDKTLMLATRRRAEAAIPKAGSSA